MVGKAQKLHGATSELNSVFGLEKLDRWNTIRIFSIRSRNRSMRFLGFSNHEKRAPRQEISKWSTVCSTFSRSGCSVVRSASLAKGSTSKKRPSPHLHKVPTLSNKFTNFSNGHRTLNRLKWSSLVEYLIYYNMHYLFFLHFDPYFIIIWQIKYLFFLVGPEVLTVCFQSLFAIEFECDLSLCLV
jgi:hypothetical protein